MFPFQSKPRQSFSNPRVCPKAENSKSEAVRPVRWEPGARCILNRTPLVDQAISSAADIIEELFQFWKGCSVWGSAVKIQLRDCTCNLAVVVNGDFAQFRLSSRSCHRQICRHPPKRDCRIHGLNPQHFGLPLPLLFPLLALAFESVKVSSWRRNIGIAFGYLGPASQRVLIFSVSASCIAAPSRILSGASRSHATVLFLERFLSMRPGAARSFFAVWGLCWAQFSTALASRAPFESSVGHCGGGSKSRTDRR